jgi:hypothetical protein
LIVLSADPETHIFPCGLNENELIKDECPFKIIVVEIFLLSKEKFNNFAVSSFKTLVNNKIFSLLVNEDRALIGLFKFLSFSTFPFVVINLIFPS